MIEIVANTARGTEVQYGLKDSIVYLNCNDADNTSLHVWKLPPPHVQWDCQTMHMLEKQLR